MNPSRPSHPAPLRPRGSALLTVIIFTTFMSLLAGSILTWSLNERRLNTRTVYWIEARNAAEALCEYGAAQINNVTANVTLPATVATTFFDPEATFGSTNNPLQLPVIFGSTNSFFNPDSSTGNGITTESHIDTNPLSYIDSNGITHTDINGLELIGGREVPVPASGALYTIPNIPENINDPYVTLPVLRSDYSVIAKATAVPHDGTSPITSYVQQIVSVRGAPLFDWAIFYASSDLEIYPGAPMVITGPVHTNYDMYINATSGATIDFEGPVTTTGQIFHSMENSSDGQSAMSNDNITFEGPTPAGGGTPPQVSMYSGSIWTDSTYGTDVGVTGPDTPPATPGALGSPLYQLTLDPNKTNFATHAEKTWPSNVLTKDMGVPPFNPKGFNNSLAANFVVSGTTYLAKADLQYVDNGSQIPVAGAVITIDHHISDTAGTVATGNVSNFNDPPDSDFPTMLASNAYYVARKGLEDVKYANLAGLYILVNVNTTTNTATVTYYGPYNFNKIGTAAVGTNGRPGPNGGVLLGQNTYSATGAGSGPSTLAGLTGHEPYDLVSFMPYQSSGGNVTNGLYDQRQKAPIDLVMINVNALNQALMDVNNAVTIANASHIYPGETGATDCLDAIVNYQDPNPNGVANSTHVLPNATIWGSGTMVGNTNAVINDNTAGFIDGAASLFGGWNGTVYVDVEENPALDPNVVGNTQVGVCIGNGQTTVSGGSIVANTGSDQYTASQGIATINLVPNNTDNTKPDKIVGSYGFRGLTIATNAPVYIAGNFNADGQHTTAVYANQPDDTVTPTFEAPVSIIGDAVTFLSPLYFGPVTAVGTKFTATPSCAAQFPHCAADGTAPPQNTPGNNAYNSFGTKNPAEGGTPCEVAMAMVAGLVLTNANDSSGGAHNLPRYLENWQSPSLTAQVIRGSLVNLYPSKVSIQPYKSGNVYYEPPDRVWGFANLFKSGVFPPATPYTYSNRRLHFNDLSEAQYKALRIDPTWGWPNDVGTLPALP